MKNQLPLPKDKKLTVVYRVEPGNLGPDGALHIDEFCKFSQTEAESIDSDFIHWEIIPRNDKSLPEMEYKINHKKLSHDKAARYLQLFNKSLDEFENHFNEKLVSIIDQYLQRE